MPEIYDPSIIQQCIQALKGREAREAYLDGIVSHLTEFKVSGKPLADDILVGNDLQHGAELFGLQDFSPKVHADMLLSMAYFRSPVFQEGVATSMGYVPGEEMSAQDAELYNSVVERAREAYSDISFEATENVRSSHTQITWDGKTVIHIPDGNNLHELDAKTYRFLGVTTHEMAHYIYNSAAVGSVNPGIYHQGEDESLEQSKHYGKEGSPYDRINESSPDRQEATDRLLEIDNARMKEFYNIGAISEYQYGKYLDRVSSMTPEELAKHEHVDIALRHDNTGYERAADVHAARMIMLHEGIWNPFGQEPLCQKHIEEFQKRFPESRIFEYWNTREATYFLKTIAQNEGKNLEVGSEKNLQEFIRYFDAEKFMGQLGQFASIMSGQGVSTPTQTKEPRQAYAEEQGTVREGHLSTEKLMSMSAMNYEAEMQSLNEGQQEHRSAGLHI